MRIAYVCADPGVPVFGSKGCSIHVQAYLRAFQQRGCEITLLAMQTGGTAPPDCEPERMVKLSRPLVSTPAEREQALLAANTDLGRALEENEPFDLVYERHALWSHEAMSYARRTSSPGILEVNAPLVEEQEEHRVLVDRIGAEQTARMAFDAASRIVAVSEQVADYLRAQPGIADKVIVIPNGVDVDRFGSSNKPVADGEWFTVGFVGTLKPWHGLDDLIDSFKSVSDGDPSVRLLIVGDGPERGRIEERLELFKLSERATLTGKVPHHEVPELISRMNVAIAPYPSSGHCYFSPLKLYEYMASGVPVVASDTGQISSTITDGVNGLLYRPGDVEALAGAIRLVKARPELAAALGKAARADASDRHTWSASLDRLLESVESFIRPPAEVL